MTTTETPAPVEPVSEDAPPEPRGVSWRSFVGRASERLRWVPSSLRARIVAWFVGILSLTVVAFVVVTYQVLLIRLDQRIDSELAQEAAELRRFAPTVEPPPQGTFTAHVERVFRQFLRRNVPGPDEAFITFVGGEPFLRSSPVVPYRLDGDPEIVARWSALTANDRGSVSTPAGRVEYLAVPVQLRGETGGLFVAAIFRDRAKEDADSAVLAAGAVALGALLLGSLLAWRLADRVVRPVSALTTTARSISETDLSSRIPVEGRGEVAQLASTFNAMLDRLERAFASQRQFADDAGHELRTPLTIVRGHLELLEQDPEERRETLALVTDELDRMGRIVEDLLLLARREEPDFLSLSTVDVGTLTDELLAKASALAPRDWRIESRGRGVIVADRQRLTQAVIQLAENATRYSDDSRPISIGSSVVPGEARFWVRDEGRGIPADEQDAIFERFRRGGGPRRTEGAGLGLAIVKAIAEAHHGRVELVSGPNVGTTFWIIVPVDQPADPGARP
jgi:signal transduction histidine kinase